jgi:hypothetical protein
VTTQWHLVTFLAMPPKLAFMTVGILRESVGHAQVQGFVDRVPSVYLAADNSDGFHARSIRDVGTWLHSWGEVELPACFPTPPSKEHIAMTLSLWQDLESVAAFAYHGPHGEALTKRREWFEKSKIPGVRSMVGPVGSPNRLERRQCQAGTSPHQRPHRLQLQFCPALRFQRERNQTLIARQ